MSQTNHSQTAHMFISKIANNYTLEQVTIHLLGLTQMW